MNSLDSATITLRNWRTPATAYPRSSLGCAEIVTAPYTPGFYANYFQRGYKYFEAARRLPITALEIDGSVVMVDDPPHWWAMQEHAANLSGHVLCAGLGLGLIVHTLDACDAVTKITVIEREPDVIELVRPLVPENKLTIIQADFHELPAGSVERPDGILYDLFVGSAQGLLSQAIDITKAIICVFGASPVRVHGFPNPWIEDIARASLLAEISHRTGEL